MAGNDYDLTELSRFHAAAFAPTSYFCRTTPNPRSELIHAQCFHWLAAADSALAERLHQKDNFPITLAIKAGSSLTTDVLKDWAVAEGTAGTFALGLSQDIEVKLP